MHAAHAARAPTRAFIDTILSHDCAQSRDFNAKEEEIRTTWSNYKCYKKSNCFFKTSNFLFFPSDIFEYYACILCTYVGIIDM